MGISTKSTRNLAVLALALTSSPIGALAQSIESVTVESVTGPNGEKQELKFHTPPGPPPVSNLAPLSELLSVPEAPEAIVKPYEALVKPYTNTRIDVLTYHYDNRRSGWNPNEVDLTPKTVASPRFALLKTLKVDGNVFAQPLLVSNFKIKDNKDHDVLIIAAGHNNTVYAFDANTFEALWPKPVSLGPAQQTLDLDCGDVKPEYGISSTPVIVRKSKDSAKLYVVSATEEPIKKEFHTFIHALDLTTGQDLYSPKEIAPSATYTDGSKLTFNPKRQWSRAGLAYNNGGIYVSIGSHCDIDEDSISGWVLKYSENLDLQASFHTISAQKQHELASIWMTGFAPAIDTAGNLFVVTGNGDFNPPDNYGESVLKLNGETLTVDDYFTPANYSVQNQHDLDFGSGGVVLFSADSGTSKKDLAAAIGKAEYQKEYPVLYLLEQANLGKNQQNNAGAVQTLPLPNCSIPLPHKPPCQKGVYGGPAVFQSQNGLVLFVQSERDVLRSYLFSGGATPKFTPSSVKGVTTAGYGGSIPVVSSDGGVNGVVWLLRRSAPIELEAYDASTLGSPLCSAIVSDWSNPTYGVSGNSFLTPMVANGRVYAPGNGVVQIFGLAAEGVNTISSACGASIQSKR